MNTIRKPAAGIYRGWSYIENSSATTINHIITGLVNGTVYKYKIRAESHQGVGDASSEVTVTPEADNTAPTLGTVTASSTDGTVVSSVRYLNTRDTVTLSIPGNRQ